MDVDVRDLPYYVRVESVTPLAGHRIELRFNDGNRGIYDMTPLLGSGVFRALRDDGLFSQVHVSFGVVTWNDEIDLSSERLWTDCEPIGADWRPALLPAKYFRPAEPDLTR